LDGLAAELMVEIAPAPFDAGTLDLEANGGNMSIASEDAVAGDTLARVQHVTPLDTDLLSDSGAAWWLSTGETTPDTVVISGLPEPAMAANELERFRLEVTSPAAGTAHVELAQIGATLDVDSMFFDLR
jgi:hypothetical protein